MTEETKALVLRPLSTAERSAMQSASESIYTVPISGLINHVARTAPNEELREWVRTYGALIDGSLVILAGLENAAGVEDDARRSQRLHELLNALIDQVPKLRAIGQHLGACGLARADEAPKIITEPTTH